MKTTFTTTLFGVGNNTGIVVPAENVAELGTSKRPPVIVDVNGYTYVSTVAVMHGKNMLSFAKVHREATGLKAGDEIAVTLTLDENPRVVDMPSELTAALKKAKLEDKFEKLSYTNRKEAARDVSSAKAEETKLRRIAKIIDSLGG